MLFTESNLNFQELKLISLLGSDAKHLYLRSKDESRIRWLAESSCGLFIDEAVSIIKNYNFNAVMHECEGGLEITIDGVTNFVALPSDLATHIIVMHSWLMIHKIIADKNYDLLQTINTNTLNKFQN